MNLTIGGVAIDWEIPFELIAIIAAGVLLWVGLATRAPGTADIDGETVADPFTRPERRHVIALIAAVGLWLGVSATPLHSLGEQSLFSAHMIEHLVQGFGVAPLIVLATPDWMLRQLTRPRPIRLVLRWLTKPVISFALFNLALLALHLPATVDVMLTVGPAHAPIHAVWILAAVLMWLPVLSPADDVVPRLSPPLRIVYLLGMTVAPTIPASFLTFSSSPLYDIYDNFGRAWAVDTLTDMRMAGLIMKIGGGFFLVGVMSVIFFRWAGAEERADALVRAANRPAGTGHQTTRTP